MEVFTAVTAHWLTAAASPRGRAAIESWARRRPTLAAYHCPARLVSTINQPGHPDRSCALLADLLLVAHDDPLAQLAVLQAVLPGLRHAVRWRWTIAATNGPWRTETDLASDAVSAAWEAIRHHSGRTHPFPARLIIRRVERRLRSIRDVHRREAERSTSLRDREPPASECPDQRDDEERAAVAIREAHRSGRLDRLTARLAYRVAVLDERPNIAGRKERLSLEEIRNALRLALEVLAGDTRARTEPEHSRPVMHAPTRKETDMSVPFKPRARTGEPQQQAPAVIPLLLTVNQAAELLCIGRSTLYELMDAGEIRYVKRGASRRVPLKEVHEYIDHLLKRCDEENARAGGPIGSVGSW